MKNNVNRYTKKMIDQVVNNIFREKAELNTKTKIKDYLRTASVPVIERDMIAENVMSKIYERNIKLDDIKKQKANIVCNLEKKNINPSDEEIIEALMLAGLRGTKKELKELRDEIDYDAVITLYRQNYNYPDYDHGDEYLKYVKDAKDVGVFQDKFKVRKFGRKYPDQFFYTKISIPTVWKKKVFLCGLSIVEENLVLDANRVKNSDFEVFSAKWIRQSLGYTVTVETGYIVSNGEIKVLADSIDAGIKKIKRLMKKAA